MTDLEKFYKLLENIINYPYEKAVFLNQGKIKGIKVFPYKSRNCGIMLYNKTPLKINWDFVHGLYEIKEDKLYFLNDLLLDIRNRTDKEISKALLDGIK